MLQFSNNDIEQITKERRLLFKIFFLKKLHMKNFMSFRKLFKNWGIQHMIYLKSNNEGKSAGQITEQNKGVFFNMKDFIEGFLRILNIISGIAVVTFGVIGVVYEILGPVNFEKLLIRLNILWFQNIMWKSLWIFTPILIITFILRVKLYGE